MAREGIDLLHPRIDWAGPEAGTVESELPLYAAAVAAGWSLRGGPERPSWAWPRGLSLLAWLAGALALAAWVRRRLPGSPLHYLWLYALSPLGVVFSRNVQPDALAIALFLWGCERADAMSERPGLRGLSGALFGGSLAGLAVASKGQLAFLLPLPIALLLARSSEGGRARAGCAAAAALSIPTAWYWHSHVHLGALGATFGVWGPGAAKWGSPEVWADWSAWRAIGGTLLVATLTPFGALFLLAGLPRVRALPEARPFVAALVLVGASLVALTDGFRLHNYYQLAVLPFASVLVGTGLRAWAAEGTTGLVERRWSVSRRLAAVSALGALTAGTLAPAVSFVRDSLAPDPRIPRVAAAARAVLPDDGAGVVVIDKYPQSLMFQLDRRGWHRTETDLSQILELESWGAAYLLLTSSSPSWDDPAVRAVPATGRPLVAISEDFVVLRLRSGGESPPAPAVPAPPR
jgi:hypothetical protein